ncbi:hypothetical protein [Thioclava sp. SK-1]|uniref:hypothetical protein n=1 Tax=Thioclava sp. SK-1 TaxID=1889770 RepID=UPI000A9B7F51
MTEIPSLSHEQITALFSRPDGGYAFARWGRPIVPIVFGVEADTLQVVKGAVEAVVALSGHKMAETDPELGANLMIFFFRDWQELLEVPNLDQMIEGLQDLVVRLDDAGAHQYRVFRFDEAGAVRACFSFVRMSPEMADIPAETIALGQAVGMIFAWGDGAWADRSALGLVQGAAVLRPEVAALIAAGYDPVMPVAATDASHALRLAARAAVLRENAEAAAAQMTRDVAEVADPPLPEMPKHEAAPQDREQ